MTIDIDWMCTPVARISNVGYESKANKSLYRISGVFKDGKTGNDF